MDQLRRNDVVVITLQRNYYYGLLGVVNTVCQNKKHTAWIEIDKNGVICLGAEDYEVIGRL